jgi:hypothetical protein
MRGGVNPYGLPHRNRIPPLKGALTLMVPFRLRGFGTLLLPTGVLGRPMVY